jgi:hypothetical protein
VASFDIKTYEVFVSNDARTYAYIMLYAGTPSGTISRARLDFADHPTTPNFSLTESGSVVSVKMPFRTFASVVDVLRNEKPLTLSWGPSSKICMISTSKEPVGEEELTAGP